MQIWGVTSLISAVVAETEVPCIIASVWLCILCHLHSSIYYYISYMIMNIEPCALSIRSDWSSPARTSPPLMHMSLSLGARLCLDWRSTGRDTQGVRPHRELWLTAHFDKMKEVVAAEEISLPWAAKKNMNIKWKSILTEINEALMCE